VGDLRLSSLALQCRFSVAALLVGLVVAVSACAEDVDIQPQAQPRQQGQRGQQRPQSNGSSSGSNRSGDSNRNNDNDQQPRTVAEQQQAVKRELRGQKSDPSQTAPIRDGEHQFQLKVPNYVAIRNRNIVMQQRDFSCGAACLATICQYYWGDNVTEDQVLTTLDLMLTAEETEDRIMNGLAMSDLRRAAVKLGYQSVVGTTTFAKLGEMKVPAIVGIQPSGHKHFVVLKGTFGDYVYFADPIRGNIRMPNWEFVEQWQKNAILVVHKPGEKVRKYSALSLTEADILRTQLNDQIIRSQESRQPQNRIKLSP
jgi:predicted double-glycine peptidase